MVGRPVGCAASAAGDVDHDHAGGERNAQAEEDSARRREFEEKADGRRDQRREDRLQRCRPEQAAALPLQLGQIQLDANFEEEEDHADVGEDLELMTVGDVAGGKRGEDEPDGEVAQDRRQAGAPCQPAGDSRSQQDKTDFEDGA